MVGDESPQDNRKNNSLTVSETSKKVEAFQSFANGSVSSIDDAARWLVLNRSAASSDSGSYAAEGPTASGKDSWKWLLLGPATL